MRRAVIRVTYQPQHWRIYLFNKYLTVLVHSSIIMVVPNSYAFFIRLYSICVAIVYVQASEQEGQLSAIIDLLISVLCFINANIVCLGSNFWFLEPIKIYTMWGNVKWIFVLWAFVIRVIKSRIISWEVFVARMGDRRGACRVLVGKPEGKRQLERTSPTRDTNNKMDLSEVGWGCVYCVDLVQDMNRWMALVQ
jgi:hypothetical protein